MARLCVIVSGAPIGGYGPPQPASNAPAMMLASDAKYRANSASPKSGRPVHAALGHHQTRPGIAPSGLLVKLCRMLTLPFGVIRKIVPQPFDEAQPPLPPS